jgi:sugar-specific transcriptional regulator TrmB
MGNKEKILELLKQERLTSREVSKRTNIPEKQVHVYLHRLKTQGKIREWDTEGRYTIYSAIGEDMRKTKLIEKLVCLMIEAGINTENYHIDIEEEEILPYIQRLEEKGMIASKSQG